MITARIFCIPKNHYERLTEIGYTYPYQRMRVIVRDNGVVVVIVYPELGEVEFSLLDHMTITTPVQ